MTQREFQSNGGKSRNKVTKYNGTEMEYIDDTHWWIRLKVYYRREKIKSGWNKIRVSIEEIVFSIRKKGVNKSGSIILKSLTDNHSIARDFNLC